ncbi:ubiquitin-like with PHD and RING finger domains 2 [Mortierella sp. GBA35]|nr:ubiquitin-like with PHD and RING finger domains 2 [Mortierella sp. GBA35]
MPEHVETLEFPSHNTTIQQLRNRIANAWEVHAEGFDLLFNNEELDDDNTLNKSGIPHNGTITVVPHNRGKVYGKTKKKVAATASLHSSTRVPPLATEPEQDVPQGPPAQLPDMRFVGAIPGVPVGTKWNKRIEVAHAGVHRPPMSGIAGKADVGAESVVLSGGYPEDEDHGLEFTYTGSGGRESGQVEQTRDQELTRANQALAMTCDCPLDTSGGEAVDWKRSQPIRVVRGYQLGPPLAPKAGYRYDGIYKLVRYWPETGRAGFRVWRYHMRRDDPEPAPWEPYYQIPGSAHVYNDYEDDVFRLATSRNAESSSAPEAEAADDGLFGDEDDAGSVGEPHAATAALVNEGPSDEDERLRQHPMLQVQNVEYNNWMGAKDVGMDVDSDIYQGMCLLEAADGEKGGSMAASGLSDNEPLVDEDENGIGDNASEHGYAQRRVQGQLQGPVHTRVDDAELPEWLQPGRTKEELLDAWR